MTAHDTLRKFAHRTLGWRSRRDRPHRHDNWTARHTDDIHKHAITEHGAPPELTRLLPADYLMRLHAGSHPDETWAQERLQS